MRGDCASKPCQNGGTCTDTESGHTCKCPAGYGGANCETNVDECAANPCKNGGTCTDGVNSYTCQCAATYEGAQCTSCVAGRGDCNTNSADGCEALLGSDANKTAMDAVSSV
ncbi:hypothetical protein AKJ09_05816 [Labilithrix luteola]|uniref:EGF-like domain-containing protein n=1 Tax=Labilithrix luteola TaxID=1391654 RepID=A0A0K1Q082_9BACT|nr:hypothetical protein AKJ09_05816 [Labilithrix luteola]